jgi:ABC-type transporter Mla subunit MlaD
MSSLGYRERMRIPPVPGPRDVVRLLERGAEAVDLMLAAVPRVSALLDEAGPLLHRANALIERIDVTRAAADEVVRRTDETVTEATRLVHQLQPLTRRLIDLLDSTEPSLTKLQPTLDRLAETTHPAEIDALVTLVDHLPVLTLRMETDVIPVLDSLSTVSPDLHDLLDISRSLNEMLGALPGVGRIKKRIDEEQED